MNLALSHRDRRALIAGACTLVLIVTIVRVAPSALRVRREAMHAAALLMAQVTREEASMRFGRVTRDSLVQRQVRLMDLDSTLFDGDLPSLAAASLSELLSDTADESNVQLGAVQMRADSSSRRVLASIEAQTTVSGSLRSVAEFLSRLEHGKKLLRIREVTLTSQSTAGGVSPSADAVRADVIVEGLGKKHSAPVIVR